MISDLKFNKHMPVNYLRKIYRTLTGKNLNIKISIEKKHEWYGSNYGGFFVCPDNLNKDSIVYSFGIGEDISFDLEIFKRHQCTIFGFDPTPKSIRWVQTQDLPPRFNFLPFGIAPQSGETEFYLPQNQEYVSGSILKNQNVDAKKSIKVMMKSFADIIKDLGHTKIDILKMDIEGAEYDVIPEILKMDVVIDQILLEFHHRMVSNGKSLTLNAIDILKKSGYEIFGISDTYEEVSFIRKTAG